MKRRRITSLVLIGGLMLLLFGALALAEAIPPKPAAITMTNMGTLGGDPGLAHVIKLWEKETGIKVNVIELGETWAYDKLISVLSSRDPSIDVVASNDRWIKDWAAAGWLEPLDPIAENILEYYPDPVKDGLQYKGKTYGLHGGNMVSFVYYRTDLLKEAGYASVPQSWEEMVEFVRKATKDTDGDGVIDQWGIVHAGIPRIHFGHIPETLLHQIGGRIFTGDEVTVNSAEGIRALAAVCDLRNKYKVSPPGVNTYDSGDVLRAFISGKAAMAISWSWMVKMLDQPDSVVKGKWAVTALPVLEGGRKSAYYITTPLLLNVVSKNKYWSMDFIKTYCGYDGQVLEMIYEPGNVAFMPGAFEDSRVKNPPAEALKGSNLTAKKYAEFLSVFKDLLEYAEVEVVRNQGTIERILWEEENAALSGTKTPKEALDGAAAKIRKFR